MIKNKKDLEYYLERDRKALHKGVEAKASFFSDLIWRYQILLRRVEYYKNKKELSRIEKIQEVFAKFFFKIYGLILGYSIYPNNFGPGLSIAHRGTIVVNENARIGENCRIHVCVNIGISMGDENAVPIIGNNVYIGPGAKIFGKVQIADYVAIGANAVVNRSMLEKGVSIGGIPARKISENGSPGITIG